MPPTSRGHLNYLSIYLSDQDGSKCENKVVAPTKWASAELVHPIPSWSKR